MGQSSSAAAAGRDGGSGGSSRRARRHSQQVWDQLTSHCPVGMRRHLSRIRLHGPGTRLLLGLPALALLLIGASHLLHRLAKEFEFFPQLPYVQLELGTHSGNIAAAASAAAAAAAAAAGSSGHFVHQSWKTSHLPVRFATWSASWQRCFPAWTYKLWTDADNEAFVRAKFPAFYPVWRSLPTTIERVDSVRYLYMYSMGGLYADLDSECLRPFQHLLANCSVVLGAMSVGTGWTASRMPSGLVQNSLMYSRPGQRIWLDAIEEIERIARKRLWHLVTGNYPLAEDRTGPLMIMRLLKANWPRYQDSVCLYRPGFFNPFSWYDQEDQEAACRTLNGMTEAQLAACRGRHNASYAIQYHTQVWRHGKTNMAGAA